MTANQLCAFLEKVINDGYGHAEILFDTEAKTFDYHMAAVGSAYLETEPFPDRPFVSLHEAS
jgi:hypothetical protein